MPNIRKRGKSYQITVSNGRTPEGKQIIETSTWSPDPDKTERQNQKALQLYALEFEQKVKNEKYLDGEKITFQSFSETWMKEYAQSHLAPATVKSYGDLLRNHILPEIGNQRLSKLQPRTLNNLYKKLSGKEISITGRDGKLSYSTIRNAHMVISAIYRTAIRWGICTDNPCQRAELPRKGPQSNELKFFTLEEAERFLAILEKPMVCPRKAHDRIDDTGNPYHVSEYVELQPIQTQMKIFFHIALFTGCRRGELIALQWQDINFETGAVEIKKSTGYVNKQIITKETKNKSSNRTVYLPKSILIMLKNYRKEQMRLALSLGDAWMGFYKTSEFDQNYIFIQHDGKQMHPSTPYHAFQKIIRRYNAALPKGEKPLPEIPLHGLRHTAATLLISQNTDIKTVSGLLGHSQSSTTINIYAHSLEKSIMNVADTMEKMLVKR